MTMKRNKWTVPPELAPYDRYTNYSGRAEELINSDASVFNNHVVAIMRAEMHAQYALLARLRHGGLLAVPEMAASEDLRDAMRREIAAAEQVPFDQLEPYDYQEHVDRLLALLASRALKEKE